MVWKIVVNVAMVRSRLATGASMADVQFVIAKRAGDATTERFEPITDKLSMSQVSPEGRLMVGGVTQLNGQYVVLLVNDGNGVMAQQQNAELRKESANAAVGMREAGWLGVIAGVVIGLVMAAL
ncbi:hypothetical protein LTS18_012673 [Coniosporium uncinatum]|uniref:Uncharacterized protein n=1 Tax=Coniosporium uncinatum TaxID=93489 RepID=A0ACC3CXE3_9PEZI|nr:hypothetical protein LTS18_012673 [Coniosporium uncinatum]